jgi:type II secretory pathway component PulJ
MERRLYTGGFSYIEILIAVTLFAILLVAVLPIISQASRNMAYAQDRYEAHLWAHNLMLIIREELELHIDAAAINRAETRTAIYSADRGGFLFTFWINGTPYPPTPSATVSLMGFAPERTTIIVVIWDGHENIIARAFGVI